ncbi:phage tail protein [Paraflavitalea sp. CAU 1676]|uniref:phage tail protein n=1 Tax=Paraflavitalea sp. CAU 1676 TaxID=3032598 RepID=UPI0023DB555B|nr:phage tail protein [Paraflavitalea sp. CAU 1676]MDF2188593.1 phage tail protein [Paraflavitalea sp. CAU 1676]
MANYPLPKFHFRVEWGGSKIGFTEVTGLNIENEMIEYRDGSSPEYHKIKMPGLQKYGNVTLKRGMFNGDNEFFQWLNTVSLSKIVRRDITISLLNENHEPVYIWRLKNAWPTKVTAPDLKSDANEVAVETIEMAHEGLVIEAV